MFIGEALHALEFHHEHVFDQDVAIVFPNRLALITDDKRCLSSSPDAAKSEFPQQGALVHLFEEPGPQVLETSRMAPITRSVSESGHRRSSVFIDG